MVTAHGDVPIAVAAMKEGAIDFIEKPFSNQAILNSVHRALEVSAHLDDAEKLKVETLARIDALTPREKDVMTEVVGGAPNKGIAKTLGISERTVEIHRSRVMDKMKAASLADLVRMAVSVEASG